MFKSVWLSAAAAAFAVPVGAQDVAPSPVAAPVSVNPPVTVDSSVEPFYAVRPGLLIWLRDADTRAGAAHLVEILKRAPIDGLADGPTLAAGVEAALAGTASAEADRQISRAWVRYAQALKSPVDGIDYGDPALQPRTPTPLTILSQAAAAPSLADHLDAVASVNPLYSALRAAALAQGQEADPRVRASLVRLRLLPAKGKAILVDIANAQMMMLENGQAVDQMKVIVGKPVAQTPLIASTIHYVTLNPYWHIPQDVAKRVVAPLVIKRGVAYLKAARYDTVEAFGSDKEVPLDPASIDWKAVAAGDVEAHVRQRAGGNNMMGKMKFGFMNDYGVFLHDTPHKNLFAKDKRTLSLGCVRLEHPERLAAWLMGRDPVPSGDGPEENVLLEKGVPVYFSYLTARPDGSGVAFAADVYNLDAAQ